MNDITERIMKLAKCDEMHALEIQREMDINFYPDYSEMSWGQIDRMIKKMIALIDSRD